MRIQVFAGPLTVSRWKDKGGGYKDEYEKSVQNEVNEFLENCKTAQYKVHDIKVNHFTADRHNNGGYDEIWVQYTVMYDID